MSDIYERFAALPRARRGTTTVVIVDEEVLAQLIADAQTSEARLFEQGVKRAKRWVQDYDDENPRPPADADAVSISKSPAASSGNVVLNVTSTGHPINLVGALEESLRKDRLRRDRSRRTW